jgi:hypothetical protein
MPARQLFRFPYGFGTTAAEVLAGVDLLGRRMIVTGANSGIGAATCEPWRAPGRRSRSPSETW